ncbi:MAG: HEAT repeat domain-containing protein [Sandaracinaceae bacterium]|nr:HEAT repeat domain-containing protein [Sandaracinaceae bacterium]
MAEPPRPGPKPDTLRPPAPGREDRVALPGARRPRSSPPPRAASPAPAEGAAKRPTSSYPPPSRSSYPPPASEAPRRRPSSRPPKGDPRGDGGGVFAELVRGAALDARESAAPDPLPPDRSERIGRLVTQLARSGPDDAGPLVRQLVAFGNDALPAVAAAFPGVLWVDLARPHRPLESGRLVSGLANTLIAFEARAAPYLTSLLRAKRPETRLAAALVATDLRLGALVQPLAARLLDDVPVIRHTASRALHAVRDLPETAAVREELLRVVESRSVEPKWRARAAAMIAQLRDERAVERLIDLLGDAELEAACREALVLLVGRDVGRFRLQWHAWHAVHGRRGRASWLIDALDQPDPERRAAVVNELVLLTGEGFERRHAIATREQARELGEHYRRWLEAHPPA